MATLLFDFDSTIVNSESLEVLLSTQLKSSPEKLEAMYALTDASMNGELPFHESLQQRLAIASPTHDDIRAFCSQPDQHFTQGMPELIQALKMQGHSIWVISGGIHDLILPFAHLLSIPDEQVFAAELIWNEEGHFVCVDTDAPCSHSKLEAAKLLRTQWTHPVIAIGDGFTDFELQKFGYADYFVGYAEHVERPFLAKANAPIARNTNELKTILNDLLQ